MKTPLFWVITQRVVIIPYRRFGTTCRSHLQQPRQDLCVVVSSWNVMAHGDAREEKWRGNWRMEWVASTLRTTSEHGVSSITTADAHTSAAPVVDWNDAHRRFEWTRPFRRKTKSGFCACAITFQLVSTEQSARNYHYSLRNDPEECTSVLIHFVMTHGFPCAQFFSAASLLPLFVLFYFVVLKARRRVRQNINRAPVKWHSPIALLNANETSNLKSICPVFLNSCRRLPETKRHSSLFLHWSGSKFLVVMAACNPSIHDG